MIKKSRNKNNGDVLKLNMKKRFGVAVLHPSGKYEVIYENIHHYGEVELLSQLAMSRRTNYDDIIVIIPEYNRSIEKNDPKAYKMALGIEHKYINPRLTRD